MYLIKFSTSFLLIPFNIFVLCIMDFLKLISPLIAFLVNSVNLLLLSILVPIKFIVSRFITMILKTFKELELIKND